MGKRLSILLALLLLIPFAAALEGPSMHDMGMVLAAAGKMLHGILRDAYGQYLITFILAGLLFYTLYAALASRVHLFRGLGGLGLNGFGKTLCIALSGLTCLAIFTFRDDVLSASRSFFLPFGIYGGVLLAAMMFLLVYKGFRDKEFPGLSRFATALIAAVLAWLFYSYLVDSGDMLSVGVLFLIGLVLYLIISGIWRHTHRRLTPRRLRGWEGAEERAVRDEEREARDEQAEAAIEGEEAKRAQGELERDNVFSGSLLQLIQKLRSEGSKEQPDAGQIEGMIRALADVLTKQKHELQAELPEEQRDLRVAKEVWKGIEKHSEKLRRAIEGDAQHRMAIESMVGEEWSSEMAAVEQQLARKLKREQIIHDLREGKEKRQKQIVDKDKRLAMFTKAISGKIEKQGTILQHFLKVITRDARTRSAELEKLEVEEWRKRELFGEKKSLLISNIKDEKIIAQTDTLIAKLQRELEAETAKTEQALEKAEGAAAEADTLADAAKH